MAQRTRSAAWVTGGLILVVLNLAACSPANEGDGSEKDDEGDN